MADSHFEITLKQNLPLKTKNVSVSSDLGVLGFHNCMELVQLKTVTGSSQIPKILKHEVRLKGIILEFVTEEC